MQRTQYSGLAPLAQRCLAHLDREESYLQQTRSCLIELNEALRKGGMVQIDSTRVKQAQLVLLAEQLSETRTALCEALAEALQLPIQDVTLSRFAAITPSPWSERLAETRDRLRPIVAEVHFLNTRNISLINYCRSYLQRIFNGATGATQSVTRYGRSGSQLDSAYGTLFVAMG